MTGFFLGLRGAFLFFAVIVSIARCAPSGRMLQMPRKVANLPKYTQKYNADILRFRERYRP